MFGGSTEKVALRIENDLIGPVIDQFGKDIAVQKSGEDHFTTEVSVNVSPSFFSWIFQFGGKAVITGPDSVVVQMRQLMQQQCQTYQVDKNMSP
jgi:acetoin utilization deacetylase AcuC-like enzyme